MERSADDGTPQARRDIVVVGASAGGIDALTRVVAGFPADLPAAVFVVVHFPPTSTSALPKILSRAGPLPALAPGDEAQIEPGRIYVATPNYHLRLEPGSIRLAQGPRHNGVRPAVDVLFRSAAIAYGPRVIGIVLSGTMDDGTAGAMAIRQHGGLIIVQDPSDALFPGMIDSVIAHAEPDYVLPADEIGATVASLVRSSANSSVRSSAVTGAAEGVAMDSAKHLEGPPSSFVCPECHGALWETNEGDHLTFRCHVGHAYSAESMYASQAEDLEHALWVALRTLKDRVALSRLMAERAMARGHHETASKYAEQAVDNEERAAVVRQAIERGVQPLSFREFEMAVADEAEMTERRERADQE